MTRANQAQRVLALLEAKEWVSSAGFAYAGILCYTKRISELRKSGHVIVSRESRSNGRRRVEYRLEAKAA